METSASFEARSAPSSYPTISLLGGASAGWPLAACALQGKQIRRVGALILGNADADAFRKELREGLSKLDISTEESFRSTSARRRGDSIDAISLLLPGMVSNKVRRTP